MVIDGKDLILGRLASFAAKRAMEGENVVIVNSEQVIISGKKKNILEKYKERTSRGDALKGPFFPRTSDRLVRRTIRGMLPYKQEKGRKAFKRVMCYVGVPEKYINENFVKVEGADASKLKIRFISVGELTKLLKK